jgi:hypothetical protein
LLHQQHGNGRFVPFRRRGVHGGHVPGHFAECFVPTPLIVLPTPTQQDIVGVGFQDRDGTRRVDSRRDSGSGGGGTTTTTIFINTTTTTTNTNTTTTHMPTTSQTAAVETTAATRIIIAECERILMRCHHDWIIIITVHLMIRVTAVRMRRDGGIVVITLIVIIIIIIIIISIVVVVVVRGGVQMNQIRNGRPLIGIGQKVIVVATVWW